MDVIDVWGMSLVTIGFVLFWWTIMRVMRE